MFTKVIQLTFRVVAITLILSPIIFNVLMRGKVVTSLIFIPFVSLALLFISMYLDSKLALLLMNKLNNR